MKIQTDFAFRKRSLLRIRHVVTFFVPAINETRIHYHHLFFKRKQEISNSTRHWALWIQVPPEKILYPPNCTLSAFLAATWIHRGVSYLLFITFSGELWRLQIVPYWRLLCLGSCFFCFGWGKGGQKRSPQMVVKSKGKFIIFQGNVGWWNIIPFVQIKSMFDCF